MTIIITRTDADEQTGLEMPAVDAIFVATQQRGRPDE
jgi:hypothetical protein